EVGSGDGLFSFYLADRYSVNVTGLELNAIEATACQHLAAQRSRRNLHFVGGRLEDQPWTEQFDLVYCLDVLEHVPDDVGLLVHMRKVLKPSGRLLVHVPNRHYLDTDRVLRTVPDEAAWKVNPGHVRAGYTPDELSDVLTRAGYRVDTVQATQGLPIAWAHRLHLWAEKRLPLRLLILPLIDVLTFIDRCRPPAHGNTLWALAHKA
ncbi:MAG TPA: methyltransferase domain-containing protein, partial [Candidatus Xenobia bacterium]